MKIFIAGASGAIGSHLVPQLVACGHEVVGTTRSAAKTGTLRALGAEPVILDALDPDSVADVVAKAEPEVIVHQLTALSGPMKLRNVKRMAAITNRLRTEGTDHLLAAGRAVAVRRFVAQSNYALLERASGPVADEEVRIEPNPPKDVKDAMDALRHMEEAVTGPTWGDGIVLRYGGFYGPGTGIEAGPGAVMAELIRKRRFPIVGGGGGVWSMVHITDAASATVAAIERGRPGIYHVAMTSRHRCATYCGSWPACSAPPAGLASPLGGRQGRRGHNDAGPWDLQREGQARTGLDTSVSELAHRVHRGTGITLDMSASDLYGDLRPRAFAIAYQMLGSVSEAEDVVQEAFLRLHKTLQRDEQITSPRAYIATLANRLAIDQLRSARARRERYVGDWLPEPVVTEPTPAERARLSIRCRWRSWCCWRACRRSSGPRSCCARCSSIRIRRSPK